jgi:hypothetical protein
MKGNRIMKRIIAIMLTAAVLCLLMTVNCFAGDGSVDAVLTWGEFLNDLTAEFQQAILDNAGTIAQGIMSILLAAFTIMNNKANKKARTGIETQSTSLSTTAGNIKKAVEDKLKEVITAIEGMTKVVMDKLDAIADALRENARENRKLRAEVRENNVYWRENMKYSQLTDEIKHGIIKQAEAARVEVLEEVTDNEGNDEA